jgi:hypothetical protein
MGFSLGGMDDLPNARQRSAGGDCEEFRDLRVGGSRVDFFICVRQLDFAVAFQNGKTGNCTFRRNVPRRTAEMGNSTLNQSLDP